VITRVDVAQVNKASRVFGEKRKETYLSLTFTHPMQILATGVSECNKNFSVFFKLKLVACVQKISKIEENCLIIFSKLGFSSNLEKVSNTFLQNRRKLPSEFPKFGENWSTKIFKSGESLSQNFLEQVGWSPLVAPPLLFLLGLASLGHVLEIFKKSVAAKWQYFVW
jgi:hypothetical protein